MPEGVLLVEYADDVALLVSARDVELTQPALNQSIRRIDRWMGDYGLTLALNKTEIVLLTKKRINPPFPFASATWR